MRKHYPFRVRPVRRLAYGMTLGLLMAVSAPVPSVGAEHDAPTVISGEELLSVREVIGWIEENSRYIFIYRTDVDLDRQVSVELKVDDIPAVLDAMLAGTDLEYSIRGRQIIISPNASSSSQPASPSISRSSRPSTPEIQLQGTAMLMI